MPLSQYSCHFVTQTLKGQHTHPSEVLKCFYFTFLYHQLPLQFLIVAVVILVCTMHTNPKNIVQMLIGNNSTNAFSDLHLSSSISIILTLGDT